jgi:hypothetical protein
VMWKPKRFMGVGRRSSGVMEYWISGLGDWGIGGLGDWGPCVVTWLHGVITDRVIDKGGDKDLGRSPALSDSANEKK